MIDSYIYRCIGREREGGRNVRVVVASSVFVCGCALGCECVWVYVQYVYMFVYMYVHYEYGWMSGKRLCFGRK